MSDPHTTADLQGFAAGVQRTLAALQRLETVLLAEQSALSGSDPEALEQAVRAKVAALAELEPVVAERDTLQQRLGAGPGVAGGEQLVAGAPSGAKVRSHWEALKALAARVEKLNVQNGQLALQGEKTARQAVSILTGRPAEPQVYGRRGSAGGALGGSTLGKV